MNEKFLEFDLKRQREITEEFINEYCDLLTRLVRIKHFIEYFTPPPDKDHYDDTPPETK